MITVLSREFALGKLVDGFDVGYNLDGKWKRCLPAGLRLLFIFQVKLGGRRISYSGDGPDMVIHLVQEIGLGSAGKVEKEHVLA